jgi:hypothetical protein
VQVEQHDVGLVLRSTAGRSLACSRVCTRWPMRPSSLPSTLRRLSSSSTSSTVEPGLRRFTGFGCAGCGRRLRRRGSCRASGPSVGLAERPVAELAALDHGVPFRAAARHVDDHGAVEPVLTRPLCTTMRPSFQLPAGRTVLAGCWHEVVERADRVLRAGFAAEVVEHLVLRPRSCRSPLRFRARARSRRCCRSGRRGTRSGSRSRRTPPR